MFLAKTWKIVLPSRRNAYFQGIEGNSDEKNMTKNLEKIDVFGDLDLEGIWGRFWEGFGKPKTLIFRLLKSFWEG